MKNKLIKDTVMQVGTKRSMAAFKITVSNVKQQQHKLYNKLL